MNLYDPDHPYARPMMSDETLAAVLAHDAAAKNACAEAVIQAHADGMRRIELSFGVRHAHYTDSLPITERTVAEAKAHLAAVERQAIMATFQARELAA